MPKILLNAGCGPREHSTRLPALFAMPEWREVRVDIDATVEPDLVASITDLAEVPDASVDALWSSHNIEHLFSFEVPRALGEFLRVLKPEGFAYLKVPDLQIIAQLVAADRLNEPAYEASAGAITPHDMIYGHAPSLAAGNLFMAHRTGFTANSLGLALRAAGFAMAVLKRREYLELSALAFKQSRDPAYHQQILAGLSF